MMPENGCNPVKVDYFNVFDYISRIKLEDYVLEHVEQTSEDFDEYMKKLTSFSPYTMFYFLIESFKEEIVNSNLIENHLINPLDISEKDLFISNDEMSHERIKNVHQFVDKDEEYDYRKIDAWVRHLENGEETIYWYGVKPEDINKFMDDFIAYYKKNGTSSLYSNPFLKSILVHYIYLRIHPFKDGNGRTARMLQGMKFTELINKIYDYDLKTPPLHLSESIYINRQQYYKRINYSYFDLDHDFNDGINQWFDFMLYMFDEQINCMSRYLNNMEDALSIFHLMPSGSDKFESVAKKLQLSKDAFRKDE